MEKERTERVSLLPHEKGAMSGGDYGEGGAAIVLVCVSWFRGDERGGKTYEHSYLTTAIRSWLGFGHDEIGRTKLL